MSTEAELIERLRKIKALYERPGTEGERAAAAQALHRMRARLREIQHTETPIEFQFSMPDKWSRMAFVALLRRHGIAPYRYRGQRRTTVMARMTKDFCDKTLWPEFEQVSSVLRAHLEEVTNRIIGEAIWTDVGDAEERSGPPPELSPGHEA